MSGSDASNVYPKSFDGVAPKPGPLRRLRGSATAQRKTMVGSPRHGRARAPILTLTRAALGGGRAPARLAGVRDAESCRDAEEQRRRSSRASTTVTIDRGYSRRARAGVATLVRGCNSGIGTSPELPLSCGEAQRYIMRRRACRSSATHTRFPFLRDECAISRPGFLSLATEEREDFARS